MFRIWMSDAHAWPGVNFINILGALFLYKIALRSFSLVTVWLCDFLVQKIMAQKLLLKCWWNWHQWLFSTFFSQLNLNMRYNTIVMRQQKNVKDDNKNISSCLVLFFQHKTSLIMWQRVKPFQLSKTEFARTLWRSPQCMLESISTTFYEQL